MSYKDGVKNAIQKYHQKQLNQGMTREPKGKNKKPEKDTQKNVMAWALEEGVFLHVVDSSSYDARLRTRGLGKAEIGFPDVVGNTPDGHSLWIELKAKDRRYKLSEAQRLFLENKISQGCFAVVVDSRSRLEQYWKGYWKADDRAAYLMECLPKKRKRVNEDPLF